MDEAPEIERHWALFLDLDGTVLDIAPTPMQVTAPGDLAMSLARVCDGLEGALAVVSGRSLEEVDRLLYPNRFSGAGDHGAVIRRPSGIVDRDQSALMLPKTWVALLRDVMREWNGVLLEEKDYSVAVHFRLAPERESEIRRMMMSLVMSEPAHFELLGAKMAFEIRPKTITKSRPVETLMAMKPFQGRLPVFVGDDVTDNDGMAMAVHLGGFGLQVDTAFGGQPSTVRAWLDRAAHSLG